ncbi:GNAT family N-acetyltransferase [Candidatus Bipolaricaulota bacterium]
MPHVNVRTASESDRSRILEISSQIWDGEDYVPALLDGWYAESAGEGALVVATLDDLVIAFAHRTWLCPGIAWLEAIRTDPAKQGRGAGKAITEYLIRSARNDGAARINLSTYIDNEASIHIVESYGFRLIGTFSYLERPPTLDPPGLSTDSPDIRPISKKETIKFVGDSEFLSLARRQFPRGWTFFPFDHNPSEAIARLECRLGFWQEERLEAVLCIRQSPDQSDWITVNFLDGSPAAMRNLLNGALRRYSGKTLQTMVPVDNGEHAASIELLRDAGFKSWSEFRPDVFVYEMVL